MYFIRKKKHQKDQQAGLIFHWRGFRKHHLGKVIALLLACGFFAFSVYAIKIEGIKAPLLSKKEGVVIMLNDDDPGCRSLLLQVEERSPFPARWDPVTDQEVMTRVATGKNLLEGTLWDYNMKLEPLPEDTSSHDLASILDTFPAWPRGSAGRWRQTRVEGGVMARKDLLIRAKVLASAGLEARISVDEMAFPLDLVADDGFGQVFRFQLGLDESGFVNTCIPLPGGTTDVVKITDRQKKLAAWLRAQRFTPAGTEDAAGMVTGQLELQIEAIRE